MGSAQIIFNDENIIWPITEAAKGKSYVQGAVPLMPQNAMSKGARAASLSHFLASVPRLDILTDVAPDRSIRALDFGETRSAVPYPLLFDDVLEPRS